MIKKWTVLIYANGNNEFEPEMYQLLMDLMKMPANEQINIVVLLGRAEREMVKILRPGESFSNNQEIWAGVRRYVITKNNHNRVIIQTSAEMGCLNMADPKVLYDFIQWGIVNYPAERYMLILGGHSFEYLGTLTDYSLDLPYIMGIPEMAKALNFIKDQIDVLVMDTCYMNMVEILYELGNNKQPTVKYVLTYIEYGPIKGLPMDRLLTILEDNALLNTDIILRKVIDNLDLDLAVFSLENKKLERIKRLSNQIAGYLLDSNKYNTWSLEEILKKEDLEEPLAANVKNLYRGLDSLILIYKRAKNHNSSVLGIAQKKTTNKLAGFYLNLSFTYNNKWPRLLGGIFNNGLIKKYEVKLVPTVLPLQALMTLVTVINTQADDEELDNIFRSFLRFKGWDKITNYKMKLH